MNGLERTLAFIKNEPVDRLPFHPIIMRWTAQERWFPLEAAQNVSGDNCCVIHWTE